jgi:ankyrin repeat protein
VVFAKSTFVPFALVANLAIAGQLQEAARSGDMGLLKQALDGGASLSETDEAGDPALILASLKGHADAVAIILERGADIEVRNKGGLTALHAAAYAGNIDVVALLVERGAAVNDTKNFYHMSPLHAAAEEGHADVAAFLVANKADIEAVERNGYTPLTQAGWRGYWDVGEILLKAGAVCQKAELVGEPLYKECTRRKSPG